MTTLTATGKTTPTTAHGHSVRTALTWLSLSLLTLLAMGLGLRWATAVVPPEKVAWYLVRAAGFVAFGLLWLSVVLGLWISAGLSKRANARLIALHEFTSLMALTFAFLHAAILRADTYLQPTWWHIWVPFAFEPYRPLAVALGQIGLYLLAVVVGSFYIRRRIGARTWRLLHYTTFVLYGLVLLHAIAAGTDSAYRLGRTLYLLSGGSVLFLTYVRILLRPR